MQSKFCAERGSKSSVLLVFFCSLSKNVHVIPQFKTELAGSKDNPRLALQQVSASCQATVCLPSITCKPLLPCLKVTQCSNCINGTVSVGKPVLKTFFCRSATEVCCHFFCKGKIDHLTDQC